MTSDELAATISRALDNMERWRPDATYEEWVECRDKLLAMMARLDDMRAEEATR